PYGAWSANPSTPPIFVEGGVIVRQFKSRLDGQTGHVTHGADTFAFRASSVQHATLDRALDTAVLSTIRVGASLPHGVFAAVEADFGGLSSSGATRTEMDAAATAGPGVPDLKSSGGIIIDSLATVGIRGTSSFGSLGVELAGGLRTIQYSFDSHYLSCDTVTTILALAPVAEARVRGELWLGPWMSAGVEVGTSVLEQHAWMGGVYLGVHTRAFSGGL
ncbi:MAG TPA: hypothetical protein VFP84_06975, partial [Kofleriaceae bacterium]|nr:hypothetical protein [Kofleriaceae bacterium]